MARCGEKAVNVGREDWGVRAGREDWGAKDAKGRREHAKKISLEGRFARKGRKGEERAREED